MILSASAAYVQPLPPPNPSYVWRRLPYMVMAQTDIGKNGEFTVSRIKHTFPGYECTLYATVDWQLWVISLLYANDRVHLHASLVFPLWATCRFSTLVCKVHCSWGGFRVDQWLQLLGGASRRRRGIGSAFLSLSDSLTLLFLLLFLFESCKRYLWKEKSWIMMMHARTRAHTHTTSPSKHSFSSGTKCSNSMSSRAESTSLALSVLRLAFRAKLLALNKINFDKEHHYS